MIHREIPSLNDMTVIPGCAQREPVNPRDSPMHKPIGAEACAIVPE